MRRAPSGTLYVVVPGVQGGHAQFPRKRKRRGIAISASEGRRDFILCLKEPEWPHLYSVVQVPKTSED